MEYDSIHTRTYICTYIRTYALAVESSVLECIFQPGLTYVRTYVRTYSALEFRFQPGMCYTYVYADSRTPATFASCTKFEMDRYIDRVPIRTQGSSNRYDGRVWYELLSSIRSVNGTAVIQDQLKKSTLNQGDRVSLE